MLGTLKKRERKDGRLLRVFRFEIIIFLPFMTLIRWTSRLDQPSICDAVAQAIEGCGLPYDYSRCTKEQFFAVIPRDPGLNRMAKVNVLAAWCDPSHSQIEIEISSEESVLRDSKSCWSVGQMLSRVIPQLD